jgi:hypothetical protein
MRPLLFATGDLRTNCVIQAVRRTHVNIVDLVEWGRKRGTSDERVQTFRDVKGLRAYIKETRKIFRNTFDKDGKNSNVVLRHLLRKIFFT